LDSLRARVFGELSSDGLVQNLHRGAAEPLDSDEWVSLIEGRELFEIVEPFDFVCEEDDPAGLEGNQRHS
jgi:hypothetical protein